MPVRRLTYLLATLLLVPLAQSQKAPAAPPPTPDVLVFTNGDQLTGKLLSAAGGNVVFASDMAGSLTVLRKGVPVNKSTPAPEGTVTLADGNVLVHRGLPAANADSTVGPASVPVKDVSYIVAKQEFDHQVAGKHGFKEGWNGALTGGATLVRSTTSATTLTIVETYGKNTSPGAIPQTVPPTPSVTTLSSIFHADSERDEYFTARFYALADVAFDHNYAQGLQFQQIYGGGIGWTPIKTGKQQLDVKADLHFEEQQFITTQVNGSPSAATVPSMNIIGSTIFEGYRRTLPRKMVFTETANILPAFNNSNAYSANVTAAVAIPVFKRLSASVSTTDNYLNDPSPGYNKNSYQFVTGVTYALK
jgi:hypothetical protein